MSDFPRLSEFSVLLTNNNRSKCYLQTLCQNGFIPSSAVVLDAGQKILPEHTENDLKIHDKTNQKLIQKCPEADLSFDEKEHVVKTLEKYKIKHQTLQTLDINSKEVIAAVKSCTGDYIVYSGPGGSLLKDEILSVGKLFIHAHPGWLPSFRGSTTIYYSILAQQNIACSVILFTKEIDAGPILHRKKFNLTSPVDLDYILDPAIRTATLLEFFQNNSGKNIKALEISKNEFAEENTFYIIHPLLKHLSTFKRNEIIKR